MNERIRELAEQSGLRFTQLMSNPMVPVVDGRETDLQKFAQLIVRECGKVYIRNQQDGVMTLTQDLLQHFGVEE